MNATARKRPRAIPLRPLTLRSAPFAKRALAWSPDAELAVAADDSVHVFVPQFGGDEEEEEEHGGDGNEAQEPNPPDNPSDDPLAATETEARSQFATGSLHIPAAYPPLDLRLNQRLYAAAGLPFPFAALIQQTLADAALAAPPPRGLRGKGKAAAATAAKPTAAAATTSTPLPRDGGVFRRPGGAGSGPLTAVAGTMNSVVALAWSPTGVGRNRRAVLAVLTASGVVAVYGEGGAEEAGLIGHANDGDNDGDNHNAAAATTAAANRRPSRHYDTSRWAVLWAVGERLLVPPQTRPGTCVVSFAWSGPLGGPHEDGGALMVYRTDADEVVVLRVQRTTDGGVWHVAEAARFAAAGPHPPPSPADDVAHVVAAGTAFGLQCSPWLVVDDASPGSPTGGSTSICLVAYLARHYVGFRRVTAVLVAGQPPAVTVDAGDVDGLCLFLGADAFVTWEPGIWTVDGGSRRCRGIVATPLVARAFEVDLLTRGNAVPRGAPPPHRLAACGTLYAAADEARTNPIQDLVIHPPGPGRAPPAYTLVRLAATATNNDWYETGGGPATATAAPWPQWTLDMARRVQVSITAGVGPGAGYEADDDDEADGPDGAALQPLHLAATTEPELFLHRARFWGLSRAPGGVTAVLVTDHAALQPDRGGWYRDRSRVLFGWDEGESLARPADVSAHASASASASFARPPLSTEARMWAWMYGRGPPVLPTHRRDRGSAAPPLQSCTICGASMDGDTAGSSATLAACSRGHVFDRCGATGLAIQRPGASRVCGVCRCRTLRADAIAAMVPPGLDPAAVARLRQAVAGDVCGRCGGKFHD